MDLSSNGSVAKLRDGIRALDALTVTRKRLVERPVNLNPANSGGWPMIGISTSPAGLRISVAIVNSPYTYTPAMPPAG